MVVSFVVSCGLSGTCTGPGDLETESFGMALLLLPDPVGLWGLSFSWMTGCGFGTLTLGILSGDGGTGVGSAGSSSLGGKAAALGFSMVLADWMILEISCLCVIGAAAAACLGGTHGPGMAASLIWIQFLLKNTFGCFNHIRIGGLSFLKDLSWNGPLLGRGVLQPY